MATDFAQKLLNFLQPDKGICLFMRQANQIVKDRLELKQRDCEYHPERQFPGLSAFGGSC